LSTKIFKKVQKIGKAAKQGQGIAYPAGNCKDFVF
jgi:hypothetical protein